MIFLSLHFGVPTQAQRSGLRGERRSKGANTVFAASGNEVERTLRRRADAEGGLKNRAQVRPVLQGFGGGRPPTSTPSVYTEALLAATIRNPAGLAEND